MKPLIYLKRNGLMRSGVRYGTHFLLNKQVLIPGMKLKSIHFLFIHKLSAYAAFILS